MSKWLTDARSALRALRASKWTTIAAVVTLALGTGANVAVFAVAYGVLLRPWPFPQADRLVRITTERPGDHSDLGFPLTEFDEWQRRLTMIDGLAAFTRGDWTVRGAGDPEVVPAAIVTSDFFRVLGVPFVAGQAFGDDRSSASVVVADRYAKRLSETGATIGRAVSVGSLSLTVEGVVSSSNAFPDDEVRLWLPARSVPALTVLDERRDFRRFTFVARLKPGVSIEDLRREGDRVLAEINPGVSGRRVSVRQLGEDLVAPARPVLAAFLAAGVLVLIVACANVATLLVSRALSRRRELAVRLAIGADRSRLVRTALVETAVIASAATIAGLAIARLTLNVLLPLAADSLPRAHVIGLDGPVLAATLAVGVLVAIACGLAPALAAGRSDLGVVLRQESGTTSGGGHRVRAPLVIAQIALAVLLLTSSGLFARTVWHLWNTDIGASRDRVLTARLALTETTRFDAASRQSFVDDLLRRVRALPGVEAAGLGSNLPPRVNQLEMTIRFVDEDRGRDETHGMNLVGVTPGYFRALGIPIRSGREFDEVDAGGDVVVAVISEMLAKQIASSRDLLGTRLTLSVPTAGGKRVRPTVIGISADVKFVGLEQPTEGNTYIPWRQLPTGVSFLVVRATRDTAELGPAILRTIREIDPTMPLPVVRPLGEEISRAMASRTLRLQLVAAFAALALVVSIVGLASALARSVTERQRELAIRLALGATPGGAAGLIVGQGARLIVVGLVIGAGAAMAAGRALATLLFGVSAYDPLTYAAVMASVILIGLAACYLPARRAAAVDPISLLRAQ
jgi:predicted permease